MNAKCLEQAHWGLGLLLRDMVIEALAGESAAIHDYNGSIEQLSWIGSEREETPREKEIKALLHHIVKEEEEHYKELHKVAVAMVTDIFSQFADCECAARGNEVAKSAVVSQIKIQGRNPHAR